MDVRLLYLVLSVSTFGLASANFCQNSEYSLGPSGFCFKVFSTSMTWTQAKQRCMQDFAYLAKTSDDFDFVDDLMMKEKSLGSLYSIGGFKDNHGNFKWQDGTRVIKDHWREPFPLPYAASCMLTIQNTIAKKRKAWVQSHTCSKKAKFICQMESSDPCDNSTCQNGAVCSSESGGVKCACPIGFAGDRCETDNRPCTNAPCKNGGLCRNFVMGMRFFPVCRCPEAYEGYYCELESNPCANVTCNHGGTCVATGRLWNCTCPDGFTGSFCETSLAPCARKPCQNGGMCFDVGDSFKCLCPTGFEGPMCGSEDGCSKAGSPCLNGGRCVEPTHAAELAKCNCTYGYAGDGCEKGLCAPVNPCQNGAICEVLNGEYFCECVVGFSGQNCTKACPPTTKDGFPQKLDIMFLLDGSGSVGNQNYKVSLRFVDQVLQKIKLGPGLARVGYVQFGGKKRGQDKDGNVIYDSPIKTSSEIRFQQSANMTMETLRRKISSDSLYYTFTLTGDALEYALQRFEKDARLEDPEVAKYLVVLTDGVSTNQREKVKIVSDEMREKNVTAFAIGVGNGISKEELDYIAHQDEHRKFIVNDFNQLNDEFIQTIIQRQCYTGPCEKYHPCKNGGHCVEYDDQYVCKCPFDKFGGANCDIECNYLVKDGLPEKMDAFFLMDGSGSIEHFNDFLNIKNLVVRVLLEMNFAEGKQRAAVIQFAGHRDADGKWRAISKQEIKLSDSTKMGRRKVMDYVAREAKWEGWTLTTEAMEYVGDLVESEARPEVDKYVFVITDGKVTMHKEKLKEAVARLVGLGAKMVVVAAGSDVDDETLAIIANGEKDDIVKTDDFEKTSDVFMTKFVEKQCARKEWRIG